MSERRFEFDVIVIGGGIGGSAAAMVAAQKGLKVAMIERSRKPGEKNYFGGAIYPHAFLDILPDFYDRKPPLERPVTRSGVWMFDEDGVTKIVKEGGALAEEPSGEWVVLRSKFDAWWSEQAVAAGATLISKTVVIDFVWDADGKIIGVQTDREDGKIYAPITIICEGVNNLLTQRAGLAKHDIRPDQCALAVKQMIQVDRKELEAFFGLNGLNQGMAVMTMGESSHGLPGLGFIYTGASTVSIGVGITLNALVESGLRPQDILKNHMAHSVYAPLLEKGTLLEYGAHIIPEAGYRGMPQLFDDGVMVVGDAASMVNAMHFEGTNMAATAGRLAAETAFEAHQAGQFSKKQLSGYEKKLKGSFVYKDMKQYRNFIKWLDKHPHFMDVYPAFMNDALGLFFTSKGKPKMGEYKKILHALTSRRSLWGAIGDILSFGKAVLGL